MKNGRFQAKDIDDVFFLRCVDWASMETHPPLPWVTSERDGWKPEYMPHWVFTWNLDCLMPMFPPEVILAKASRLIERGLLTGCDCGCRGDFELTEAGRQAIRDAGFELYQDDLAAADKLKRERMLASIDWSTARYEVIGIEGTTLKARLTARAKNGMV